MAYKTKVYGRMRVTMLEKAIADASGISMASIRSTDRSRPCTNARHAVWYIARVYFKYTLPRIATLYDRDHTTVMSGIRKMKKNKSGETIVGILKSKHPFIFDEVEEIKNLESWG